MQRWRPDTCGCQFEYDSQKLAAGGSLADPERVIALCPAHTSAAQATADNQMKNKGVTRVFEAVTAKAPALTADQVEWKFDALRNVEITVPKSVSLTTNEHQTLVTALASINPKIVLR